MAKLLEQEELKIVDMIHEIRGKQIMIDSEISRTKCHNHLCDKMIIHYDIGESMSVFEIA